MDNFNLNPNFIAVLVKYTTLWLHWPWYNGVEPASGGDGVLRYYSSLNPKRTCCTVSKILFLAAKELNLTLEYTNPNRQELQNLTLLEVLSGLVTDVDVVYLAMNDWFNLVKTKRSNLSTDFNNFDFTAPIAEMHEVVFVVPKQAVIKSPFHFFSVLPFLGWFIIFVFQVIYAFLECRQKRRESFWKAFFRFIQVSLNQGPAVKTLLALFWSFSIALIICEVAIDQLFSLVTTQPLVWPETLNDLYEQKNKFAFVGHNLVQGGHVPKIKELFKKTLFLDVNEVEQPLIMLTTGKAVFFSNSIEIEGIGELLPEDRFAILSEKFGLAQYSFYVTKKWRFHKEFVKMTQRLNEAGYKDLNVHASRIQPLFHRMALPRVFSQLMQTDIKLEITVDDMKGAFIVLGLFYVIPTIILFVQAKMK